MQYLILVDTAPAGAGICKRSLQAGNELGGMRRRDACGHGNGHRYSPARLLSSEYNSSPLTTPPICRWELRTKPSKPAMTWAAGGGVAAAALVAQTSLVTAGGDGRVLLWDMRRGGRPVGSAASPDGRCAWVDACRLRLVAGVETHCRCREQLHSLAFVLDGQVMASARGAFCSHASSAAAAVRVLCAVTPPVRMRPESARQLGVTAASALGGCATMATSIFFKFMGHCLC